MERYNIFNLIHKGLRASLYQTALQLQQTDFTNESASEEMLNRVREIIMLFEGHADKEDHYILPAIAAYEPSVATAFMEEHAEDERLGQKLEDCIEKAETATTYLEKILSGKNLNDAFTAFAAFNLVHMAKEEDILNTLLWRYYSDEEIRMLNKEILAGIEPWIQDFYATWIMRGINNKEAMEWMKSVEVSAPPVVLQSLIQKAEKEFSKDRFRYLTQCLSEGVMVA